MDNFNAFVLTLNGSAQRLDTALVFATATDLAIDATDTTKVTSSTVPFTAAHVGRVLNVTSGTGFTKTTTKIRSVASGAAFGETSFGTAASSSGTFTVGRADLDDKPVRMITIQHFAANSNIAYVGDASITSAIYAEFLAKPVSSVPSAAWRSLESHTGTLRLSSFWVIGTNAEKLAIGVYWF